MKKNWKLGILLTVLMTFLLSGTVPALTRDDVRDFPGNHGAGAKGYGPGQGYYPDCSEWHVYDDDDDDDDDGPNWTDMERGWRYNPNGWWFQKKDGSWPSNCWEWIDGRWYRFNEGGHMVTGWYTDGDGSRYYLNPVDDGTLGMMRTGWQLIDGNLYYFNTTASGKEGSLLQNGTTPDGYQIQDGICRNFTR